jgi:hypothetical protein
VSFGKDNRVLKLRMESITHPNGDVNQPSTAESKRGPTLGTSWFKAVRNVEALELIQRNPNAFILAYVIGYRAQWSDKFNRYDLAPGQALIGDWKEYGMSEQKYRTAKRQLEQWGFATFKSTSRGTIASLTDERLFCISGSSTNEQGNRQPTTKQRTANGQLTTTYNAIEGKTAIEGVGRPQIVPRISTSERISYEEERKRIKEALKTIRDRASENAFGPLYTDAEKAERAKLIARDKHLKEQLGCIV